jgi:hypothetical protein
MEKFGSTVGELPSTCFHVIVLGDSVCLKVKRWKMLSVNSGFFLVMS